MPRYTFALCIIRTQFLNSSTAETAETSASSGNFSQF